MLPIFCTLNKVQGVGRTRITLNLQNDLFLRMWLYWDTIQVTDYFTLNDGLFTLHRTQDLDRHR